MKALITGMNGAVAPVVARRLWQHGHTVVAWDRSSVPTDDEGACRDFVRDIAPDWFFHFATGAPEWAETVARIAAELDVPFLFTSSVSVFSDRRPGPFDVAAEPDATDDYGRYKIECERRVLEANPEATIARLGWQIGDEPGANHMVDHLCRAAERDGRVEASRRWVPACSFLDDTAEALHRLMTGHPPGLYHLDGNPGLTFYEIVRGLDELQGRGWTVVAADSPELDNRMVDPRISVAPITARLADA
jgi:dTDP-4-dehydrorhamnose reductase